MRLTTALGVRGLALVSSMVVAGCGLTDFDITQDIAEQRAQGSPLPGPLAELFALPLNIDIDAEIKAMTTGPIASVTLSTLALTITSTAELAGDVDDWSFVDLIDIYVSSARTGSTLPKAHIAQVMSPGPARVMTFDVEVDVNLKPYVEEGSLITGEARGSAPQDDVTYVGTGVFTVHPL